MTQQQDLETRGKGELHGFVKTIRKQLNNEILGQENLVDEILACLLASGHILITGAPGLAKTTIIQSLSKHLGLSFGRIQFTPDLLPTDITGSDILHMNPESGQKSFEFEKGPIFANLVLADEINRASPRTQSALLEAMQEKRVTFSGKTYKLPKPFTVFATQNPLESEGVFPLPEAQLDRFLLNSFISYPTADKEKEVLERHAHNRLHTSGKESSSPTLTAIQLEKLVEASSQTRVEKDFIHLIYTLLEKTRSKAEKEGPLLYGAGTRAGMALVSLSKSLAFLEGKESVRWYHIERLLKPCLRHRIKVSHQAYYDGIREDHLIDEITEELKNEYRQIIEGN